MAAAPDGGAKDSKPAGSAGGGGGAVDGLTPPTMKYADEQRTQIGPAPSTQAPSISNKQHRMTQTLGGHVGPDSTMISDVTVQDLSQEKLLRDAPRIESKGHMVPSLNGIPMLAKLGQGGMGAVYYGIHPRLRSEVAVKVLPFHLAEQDPSMIRRFFREAQIAAQVRSPHLVNVMDVNEEAGLFFLVMEYVAGVTAGQYLKALLEKGQPGLSEAEALDVSIAATEGLVAAHAQGIVHRDLKPDNIMVPYQSRTDKSFDLKRSKLMDLGLARTEESSQSLTGAQAAMGTPGYMAPEQAMDAKTADKRSDVFGMGATIYALLAGRPPFRGEAIMKVLMATMHEPHESLLVHRPDVSQALAEMLDRCLDKKQENRFNDAVHLLRALKNCRKLLAGTITSTANDDDDNADDGPAAPPLGITPKLVGAKTISGGARTVTGGRTISTGAKTVTGSDDLEATLVGPAQMAANNAVATAGAIPQPNNTGKILGGVAAVVAIAVAAFVFTRKPAEQVVNNTDNTKKVVIDEGRLKHEREKFNKNLLAADTALESFDQYALEDAIVAMTDAIAKLPPDDVKKLKPDLDRISQQSGTLEKRKEFKEKIELFDLLYSKRDYDKARDVINKQVVPVTDAHKKLIEDKRKSVQHRLQFGDALSDATKADLMSAELALKKLEKVKDLASTDDEKARYGELHASLTKLQQYNDFLTRSNQAAKENKVKEAFDFANKAFEVLPERTEAKEARLKFEGQMNEQDKLANIQRKKTQHLDALQAASKTLAAGDYGEALRQAQIARDNAADDAQRGAAQTVFDAVQAKKNELAETTRKKRITDALTSARKVLAEGADINPARTLLTDAKDAKADAAELQPVSDLLAKYDGAIRSVEIALQAVPPKLDDATKAVQVAETVAPKALALVDLKRQIETARKNADAEATKARGQKFDQALAGAEADLNKNDFTKARATYDLLKVEAKNLADATRQSKVDQKIADLNALEKQLNVDKAYRSAFSAAIKDLPAGGKLSTVAGELENLKGKYPGRTELATVVSNMTTIATIEAKVEAGQKRVTAVEAKLGNKEPRELQKFRSARANFQNAVKKLAAVNYADPNALAHALQIFNPGVQADEIDDWVASIEKEANKKETVRQVPGETDIDEKKKPEKTTDKPDKNKPKSKTSVGEIDPFAE